MGMRLPLRCVRHKLPGREKSYAFRAAALGSALVQGRAAISRIGAALGYWPARVLFPKKGSIHTRRKRRAARGSRRKPRTSSPVSFLLSSSTTTKPSVRGMERQSHGRLNICGGPKSEGRNFPRRLRATSAYIDPATERRETRPPERTRIFRARAQSQTASSRE